MPQIILVESSIYCILITIEDDAKAISLAIASVVAFVDSSVLVDAADETFRLVELVVLADEGVVSAHVITLWCSTQLYVVSLVCSSEWLICKFDKPV